MSSRNIGLSLRCMCRSTATSTECLSTSLPDIEANVRSSRKLHVHSRPVPRVLPHHGTPCTKENKEHTQSCRREMHACNSIFSMAHSVRGAERGASIRNLASDPSVHDCEFVRGGGGNKKIQILPRNPFLFKSLVLQCMRGI